MATKKERFGYIVNYIKKLGAPSETAIALCCNIRAESGSEFNPQAIQVGSGAPPFTKNGQGYGLFQFSNYPSNQQIYTQCRNMADKKAIETQIDIMIKQAKGGSWFNSADYPTFNLSWNEFFNNKRNWSPRNLTFAFMRQFERPADQSQDRFTLYQKEIKELYDWSKYDSNGGSNIDDGDYESFSFDCGGKPIKDDDEDGGKEPPPKPGGGIPKDVDKVMTEIINRYNNKQAGYTNHAEPQGPYQCVALMQHFLRQFSFKDKYLAGALAYGQAIRKGIEGNKTVMGLSPKKWQWITSDFRKGDVIFYLGSAINAGYGHVNIAISSTEALNQNIRAPYQGWYPYMEKTKIQGAVGTVYGALRKFK